MRNIRSLDFYTERTGTTTNGLPVYRVSLPKPTIGNCCYHIEEKGVYVFSVGSGVLYGCACMHVGAGAVTVYDGCVDENGGWTTNPKILYRASPQIMCLWMLACAYTRGLVVHATGGMEGTPVFFSLSWLERKGPAKMQVRDDKVVVAKRAAQDVYYVDVPEPYIGAKSFFIEKKGVYVLERGPCVVRSLSFTFIGSGTFKVLDGSPDEHGFFEADRLDPFDLAYHKSNGRKIFAMSPQLIGFWALDAGCIHGLSIVASGGHEDTKLPVNATVCWIKTPDRPKLTVK